MRDAETEIETGLILAELARLRWKQKRMMGKSLLKQDAMEEDFYTEDINGIEEREGFGLKKDSDRYTSSKSVDHLALPQQSKSTNSPIHKRSNSSRSSSFNDERYDEALGNSKPMDFLSVPTQLFPKDSLDHRRKMSSRRSSVSDGDLSGEAEMESPIIEIPVPPLETGSSLHTEGTDKAPMEDLVRQLTEDADNEEESRRGTMAEKMKFHSLRDMDTKKKRSVVDFESKSPVLARRNSDTSRKKKGKDSKVVQFVEGEPELIQSKKSPIKQRNREKGLVKEFDPRAEKQKLLEEIQQLREEKMREEERRKELEHTLESMKSWETTQRLQKVLDEKKKKQARAAEKLRQEMFESNKKRRQVLEKELLLKVTRNGKEGERMIRFQRQKQEQEEMLREGAMSNFVQSMLNMWRPHLSPRSSVMEQQSMESVEERGHSPTRVERDDYRGDPLYSRIHKSSSSSTLPSVKSQGKTKQKRKKDKLLQSRKAASFDLTTTYNDLDINDRSIDLHPDLHTTTPHTDEDFVNSYDFMSGESRSNKVVTTTVCV